jgi:hypothetical protein
MRPPSPRIIGDGAFRDVVGQHLRPGQPLRVGTLAVPVERHLPYAGGAAALPDVVPETWIQTGWQTAGANCPPASFRLISPPLARLEAIQNLEQAQRAGGPVTPAVVDADFRVRGNRVRHRERTVRPSAEPDKTAPGLRGDIQQVGPVQQFRSKRQREADSGGSVGEVRGEVSEPVGHVPVRAIISPHGFGYEPPGDCRHCWPYVRAGVR